MKRKREAKIRHLPACFTECACHLLSCMPSAFVHAIYFRATPAKPHRQQLLPCVRACLLFAHARTLLTAR